VHPSGVLLQPPEASWISSPKGPTAGGKGSESKEHIKKNEFAEKYTIGTRNHVKWQTVQNDNVHSGDVEVGHSVDLDVNRGALKARFIEDTREVQIVHKGSRDS